MSDEHGKIARRIADGMIGSITSILRDEHLSAFVTANTDNSRTIQVWNFKDAPDVLRALSDHGGDEDFVILLPPSFAGQMPYWLEENWRSVSDFRLADGSLVRIAAHA